MSLKIYNTLTRKKQEFKPIKKNEVGMYVCGPTVNDVPHLGHARARIVFDILRKYLIYSGYKVKFVSNVTDIEDKIINKSKELGISIQELTSKNEQAHNEDYLAIGVSSPDIQPHATEYIKEMIDLISLLEKKGYTYLVEGDGVYYDISKFKAYGKLSNMNLNELKSKRELKDSTKGQEKKDQRDFVLWKFSKPDEPTWDSPWGKGRPGWHIECSAMSHKILTNPFDIHAGGQDLIFPHHEDEIAQSEAGYGKKMANYWMHNGMVNVDHVKMSKSLGNFKTIKDLLKQYSGEVIRYFVISSHYRQPLDFSLDSLNEAKVAQERLKKLSLNLRDDGKTNSKYLEEFQKALNDDLNTPKALAILWKLVRDEKAEGKIKTIEKIDEVFGLNLLKREKIDVPNNVKELVEEREVARKLKDWKKSDDLRNDIKKMGFVVLDGKDGPIIEKLSKN